VEKGLKEFLRVDNNQDEQRKICRDGKSTKYLKEEI